MLAVLILLTFPMGPTLSQEYAFPANEYEYSVHRDMLLEEERQFSGIDYSLTEDEHIADHYLQYLKWMEFQATRDTGFPPLRPIQEVMYHIVDSDVYRMLKKLPKGANLHSHELYQLSRWTLLDIVWNSTDFEHLYILPADHHISPWKLDFFITPPSGEGWIKVKTSNYTKEDIYPNLVLSGVLSDEAIKYPTDSRLRWRDIMPQWEIAADQIIGNINIKESYINKLLEHALEEGYQYIESSVVADKPGLLYALNNDTNYEATFGKHFLDPTGISELNLTMTIVEKFKENHPNFIGFVRILEGQRFGTKETMASLIETAIDYYNKFPSLIKGFDLVAEEDAGKSHLYFLDILLRSWDPDANQNKIPLFLHTAETNWPADLITSNFADDPVATVHNAYDAILLGTKRIRHGMGYSRHPYLLDKLKERDIAVECCPVSNQILGFYPDIRVHPALGYMRSGIPVVLGPDDPGLFGYDYFTIDWYEVFMAWGLTLADLRQLARNSLQYSSLSESEKDEAINQKWKPAWQAYITDLKQQACDINFTSTIPEFHSILPKEGAISVATKVHVYGRNFESAICKTIRCKFGQEEVGGVYVSNNHVTCDAPGGPANEVVEVFVSLTGTAFLDTNLNFTYRYDGFIQSTQAPSTLPNEPCISGSHSSVAADMYMFAMIYPLSKILKV